MSRTSACLNHVRIIQKLLMDHEVVSKFGNRGGNFRTVEWQNVRVGNLIMIESDEMIPADIVLISSSNYKGNCFLEY